MIGLSGAHRTGKSTLAKAYADASNCTFVPFTGATEVYKEMELDQAVDYPLAKRLEIQQAILDKADRHYFAATKAHGFHCITDRTPLDLIGYMFADVGRSNVDPDTDSKIRTFRSDCYDVLRKRFEIMVIVQPGIPYVVEDGKPPPNIAFQWKHSAIVLGSCYSYPYPTPNIFTLGAELTDLTERTMYLKQFVGKYVAGELASVQGMSKH